MGLEPNLDENVLIQNTEFADSSFWNLPTPWTIAGGKALYRPLAVPSGSLGQFGIGGTFEYQYLFRISLENALFQNPGGGLKILFNNTVYPTVFDANGEFDAIITSGAPSGLFQFLPVNEAIGDTVDVNFVRLFPMTTYPQKQLGLDIPDVQKTEVYPGTGADISQILASRNGKTNVGILYNL